MQCRCGCFALYVHFLPGNIYFYECVRFENGMSDSYSPPQGGSFVHLCLLPLETECSNGNCLNSYRSTSLCRGEYQALMFHSIIKTPLLFANYKKVM